MLYIEVVSWELVRERKRSTMFHIVHKAGLPANIGRFVAFILGGRRRGSLLLGCQNNSTRIGPRSRTERISTCRQRSLDEPSPTPDDWATLNYLFRDRFVVDGIRGLRSRGDGDRDTLRFGFRSRLDRLLCVGGVLRIQRKLSSMALVFQHLFSERSKRRTMEGHWDWWSPTLIRCHQCSSNCLWREGKKV